MCGYDVQARHGFESTRVWKPLTRNTLATTTTLFKKQGCSEMQIQFALDRKTLHLPFHSRSALVIDQRLSAIFFVVFWLLRYVKSMFLSPHVNILLSFAVKRLAFIIWCQNAVREIVKTWPLMKRPYKIYVVHFLFFSESVLTAPYICVSILV